MQREPYVVQNRVCRSAARDNSEQPRLDDIELIVEGALLVIQSTHVIVTRTAVVGHEQKPRLPQSDVGDLIADDLGIPQEVGNFIDLAWGLRGSRGHGGHFYLGDFDTKGIIHKSFVDL